MKTFVCAALASVAVASNVIGTNIGGWMVLEPWITPSFFYRFLGKPGINADGKSEVAVDCYTLCEVLGATEGNQMMQAHWETWATEDHIKQLAERDVEVIRLPIGDWTFTQYGPYVGCMDGAKEWITKMMDWSETYGIKVLIDVHAQKDSQNGFDNSGRAYKMEWTDANHFKHWSVESADWIGTFDFTTWSYLDLNIDNVQHSLKVVEDIMKEWGSHPALYGVEPVNEPWWNTPRDWLSDFYRSARDIVRAYNPDVLFVFHDAFDSSSSWNVLFEDDDMTNVVMDTHAYMAWWEHKNDTIMYCNDYEGVMASLDSVKYPIWIGEWSLATDVCAFWLGGFNDSNTAYQFECDWVDCPVTYLPEPFVYYPDVNAAMLGPVGESNRSTVQYGKCATDSTWFTEANTQELADCVHESFEKHVAGQFLWNFRNELEVKWSYIEAYDKGWLNFKQTKAEFLS
jgi:glucan 1,3-beta-glucosidase